MNDKELKALISLLDDDNEGIFLHVRDRLMEYGPDAIPHLEQSWETVDRGVLFQSRIENILHEIQVEECKRKLVIWYDSPKKELLDAAIIVAQYQYPNLKTQEIKDQIERIRRDCWLEINPYLTAFEKVKILNKIFFEVYHFAGDKTNFHSPLNSFINTVLERKTGNPLSLSLVYSIVANELDIPIYGVNLPNHFILAYIDENRTNQFVSESNEYGVLFYLNPYSKGALFQKDDIVQFLSGINIAPNASHFQPCSNSEIIRRMLTNLIASYQQTGEEEKVKDLTEIRMLIL